MEEVITQGDIEIEEMPQGCVLSQKRGDDKYETVVVRYPDDAVAVIESLRKMIAIQYPEYLPNIAYITVSYHTPTPKEQEHKAR